MFTDKILAEAKLFFSKDIEAYRNFCENKKVETLTNNELIIDIVSIGIYYDKYIGYALNSGTISNYILYNLSQLRNNLSFTKPAVDYVRGHLSDYLLYSKYYSYYEFSPANFSKLIQWMKATGEFTEEVKHLQVWNKYFKTLSATEASGEISRIVAFSKYFEDEGDKYFENYFANVRMFLKNTHVNYRKREDYLFCGRSEPEYFLNIFGAEIINRTQSKKFSRTDKKVVLLPSCMRNPETGECKAIQKGPGLKCTSCSSGCEINRIQNSLNKESTEVIIFKHSTFFSNYLKDWNKENNGGLVGVACALNLIKGGYELKKMNIPSQCVFLNYCGCKEHWHKTGIPTSLDLNRLERVLSLEKTVEKKALIENNA